MNIRSGLWCAVLLASAVGACGDDATPGSDADAGQDAAVLDVAADLGADSQPEPAGVAWALFEATLPLAVEPGNPFDPAEIAVDVTFTSPDGVPFVIPAFVYEPFTRALVEGREVVTSAGPREWRVRFRPPFGSPPGTWRWSFEVRRPSGTESSEPATFEAEEDVGGRGIVTRSPHDTRYLAHQDGSSFFAVGENMAWYDARGTFAYDDWLGRLADVGGNYIRVWMPSWAFGLEWTTRDAETGAITSHLGDYGPRLERAWRLDYVLDLAAARGVQVMLTLQNHGPFSTVHASEWERNPYNAANGGPLDRPADVFTDATAAELFRRRFRYIVARWGHSPQILAWELWNEFDLVGATESDEARDWTEAMAAELRRLDPWDHMVTTSIGGLELWAAWFGEDIPSLEGRFDFWGLAGLDFTQIHFYGAFDQPIDFSRDVERMTQHLRRFEKPIFVAEAGVNALGVDETRADDPGGLGFHDILWAGVFAETFGTGMNWWWDEINAPDNYDPQFGAVATFVADVAFDREGFARAVSDVEAGAWSLGIQSLVGATTTLVWIKDQENQWFSPVERVTEGATLVVAVTRDGPCRLTWIDPWGANAPVAVDATVTGGVVTVDVPPFTRDIALRVDALGR